MRSLFIGSFAAAFAMILWGFLFWGVGLADPFAHTTADSEARITTAITGELPKSGVYFIPDPTLTTPEQWTERHEKGPIAMIVLRKSGNNPMALTKLVFGYVHMLAATFLLGTIMMISNRPSYGERLQLGILVGGAGTLFANLTNPIWFDSPWGYHLTHSIYQFVAWIIAAAVLAYFIRRKVTFI